MRMVTSFLLAHLLLALPVGFAQKEIRATTEDGKQVILKNDGTWRYANPIPTPLPSGPLARYTKSPTATQQIKSPFGDFAVWIDPAKWRQDSSKEAGRLSFTNTAGNGYAMIISEKIPIPTDTLKEGALANVRQADPNATKIFEEQRLVNGREVASMKIEATIKNLPFVYYGYYYGGSSGAIQVVTYTLKSLFSASEPDLAEFLNGLEIYDTSLPESPKAPTEVSGAAEMKQLSFNSGKFLVNYDTRKWKVQESNQPGRFLLMHTAGNGYALVITERIQVPLDALPEIALANAQTEAPDSKIVFREKRAIPGGEVWVLKIQGTIKGIQFIYYGYYHGGTGGTVQLVTYTGTSLFDEYEKDFSELLNGLRINE